MGNAVRYVAVGFASALSIGSIASCLGPTEITITLTTNVDPKVARANGVAVSVGPKDGAPTTTFTTNVCADDGTIGTFVIVPSSGPEDTVAMSFTLGVTLATDACTDATIDECIITRRQIAFSPHTNLSLTVNLDTSCLGVSCPSGQTCDHGQCVGVVETCDAGKCLSTDASADGVGLSDALLIDGSADSPAPAEGGCLTKCNNVCVDLANDKKNCGACGIDCTGGACVAGTCNLGVTGGTCLAVSGALVYVATAQGVATLPTLGGSPSLKTSSPATAIGAAGSDVAWYEVVQTSPDIYDTSKAMSYPQPTGTQADLLVLDSSGFAWMSWQTGYTYFATFGTAMTFRQYGKMTALGSVALAQKVVYVSENATDLCRVTSLSTFTCLTATSTPAVVKPGSVTVDDVESPSPTVFVTENGTQVTAFKSDLTSPSKFAVGTSPLGAIAYSAAKIYAHTGAQIVTAGAGGILTKLVDTPNALQRCLAVDATSVYWLDASGTVFKHHK